MIAFNWGMAWYSLGVVLGVGLLACVAGALVFCGMESHPAVTGATILFVMLVAVFWIVGTTS